MTNEEATAKWEADQVLSDLRLSVAIADWSIAALQAIDLAGYGTRGDALVWFPNGERVADGLHRELRTRGWAAEYDERLDRVLIIHMGVVS